MIVQQTYRAVVVLSLTILGGAVVLGATLAGTEMFSPTQAVQVANANATKSALSAHGTRVAWQATETPRAFQYQVSQMETLTAVQATQTQSAIIAQATAIPVQQTATQIAVVSALVSAQANATAMALAAESQKRALEVSAKQTEAAVRQTESVRQADASATLMAIQIAREKDARNNANTRETFGTVSIGIAIGVIVPGVTFFLVTNARAKKALAEAALEREKRRTFEVQAAFYAKQERPAPVAVIYPTRFRTSKSGQEERDAKQPDIAPRDFRSLSSLAPRA
jgi:sensor c-di-GMP phosphodiesterase-like protein